MASAGYVLQTCPGLTYRQLDHWCRRGLVPGIPGGSSSSQGNPREFSGKQVRWIRIMSELAQVGLNPAQSSRAVEGLLDAGEYRLSANLILVALDRSPTARESQ